MANAGAESVKIEAYGNQGGVKWTATVAATPKDVRLTPVGGLLVVDCDSDAAHDGADFRAVLDAGGKLKWSKVWDNKVDVLYIGTDVVVDNRSGPSSMQRIDLNTGSPKWTHAGDSSFHINDDQRVKAALAWPKQGVSLLAGQPSFTRFAAVAPYQESLGADPAVAVHMNADGKGSVVDLSNGQNKKTGNLPLRDEHWFAYAGMIIGIDKDHDTTVAAYRLSDFGKAWEFKKASSIDDVRPCGENLVCAKSRATGGTKYTLDALDTANGAKPKWTRTSEESTQEPNWYVVGGKLIVGDGTFTQLDNSVAVNPADGKDQYQIGSGLGSSAYAEAAHGGYVGVTSLQVSGVSTKWRVSVVGVGDGKPVGTAVIGAGLVQDLALSDDTLVVLDKKNRGFLVFQIPGR